MTQRIVGLASEISADAIVAGKHGTGQVAGLLLGSVSQKLASIWPLSWQRPKPVHEDPNGPAQLQRRLGRLCGAKTVHLFGQEIRVRARTCSTNGFSSHADQREVLAWHRQSGGALSVAPSVSAIA